MPTSTSTGALPLNLMLRLFVPFALGYFLSFLYRVVNTVIAGDLAQDLNLNASQLGLLTSAYLISFAAFQLPLGILLDRYGPRRIEAILLLFAAAGALIFALAQSLNGLMLGRALIGFGVSACLMAALKAFVQWFPKEKLPLVNGLHFTAGGLGVLAAAQPVEWLLQFTDWRGVFMVLALATVVIAALIAFVVPEKPMPVNNAGFKQHVAGVVAVFSARTFWQVAPWAFTTQAAFIAIMSLWAGPWLRDVAGLERAAVVPILSGLALGVTAGYFTNGFVAERLSRFGISTTQVAAFGMSAFMLVQLALIIELTQWASTLWFLFGFFGTTGVLMYAYLSQQFPVELVGRVNTALNLLVFVFAFIAQWGIGVSISGWPMANSTQYAAAGYQVAFSMVLVAQVIGMGFYLLKPR